MTPSLPLRLKPEFKGASRWRKLEGSTEPDPVALRFTAAVGDCCPQAPTLKDDKSSNERRRGPPVTQTITCCELLLLLPRRDPDLLPDL